MRRCLFRMVARPPWPLLKVSFERQHCQLNTEFSERIVVRIANWMRCLLTFVMRVQGGVKSSRFFQLGGGEILATVDGEKNAK